MAKIKISLVSLCLILCGLGCSDPGVVYQKSFELSDQGWDQNTHLEDTWIIGAETEQPSLVLTINFIPEFSYQNIYLTAGIQQNATHLWSDTFSIQLANPQGGGWLGRNQGDLISVSDTIPLSTTWMSGDEIKYRINQFSREEVLQGTRTVEVKILAE